MVVVSLKNLSDFWITLETSLTNCDINFILSGSRDCVISAATGATKFEITNKTTLRSSSNFVYSR